MKQLQPPKGTRDIVYEEAAARRKVIDRLRRCFLDFGFSDFDTPAFEHLETLEQKSGPDVTDQIYTLEDKGGRKLGLIFEFTASLGRAAANNADLIRPFKRYQIGKVWRYERPQANRYREFYQADIDILGPYTMDCEVEILLAVSHVLNSFGLAEFEFLLNDRKVLRGQLETAGIEDEKDQMAVLRGLDKADKISPDEVRAYILEQGVSAERYERFMALVPTQGSNEEILGALETGLAASERGREGVAELRQILALAEGCDLARRIRLAPFLVRGLDYYTGPVFEVRCPTLGNVSFGGGGRYDTMVEMFGGRPAGAAGFAFGVERLVSILMQEKLVTGAKSEARIMVTPRVPELAMEAFRLSQQLRAAGIAVYQFLGKEKIARQFSFAAKMGFPFVTVVGEQEIESGVFRLKNMASEEEALVPRAELAARLLS